MVGLHIYASSNCTLYTRAGDLILDTGLTLNSDMVLVLLVLSATIGLFVSELVRVDVAAIMVMVCIGVLGLVPASPDLPLN